MTYLLRVEATNLDSFVFDVNDLSTARGGSLTLLNAVSGLGSAMAAEGVPGWRAISVGASVGLFEFSADTPEQARAVARRASGALKVGDLKHATFGVAVGKATEDFRGDLERLITAIRWQQFQTPTLAVPSALAGSDGACDIDRLRPSDPARPSPNAPEKRISVSVDTRRRVGRDSKQAFFEDRVTDLTRTVKSTDHRVSDQLRESADVVLQALMTTCDPSNLTFCTDLGSIAKRPGKALDGKVAVLYVDGNKFSAIQAQRCTTANLQKSFDLTLRTYRQMLVARLLTWAASPQGAEAFRDSTGALRIEVLLWGGDEFELVVPAWVGWQALASCAGSMGGWALDADTRLEHAFGLVFCHAKAPIVGVRALARTLADEFSKADRSRSLVAVETLESFDHLGADVTAYRSRRFPDVAAADQTIDVSRAAQILQLAQQLRTVLPRRGVHGAALAHRARGLSVDGRTTALTAWLADMDPRAREPWTTFAGLFPSESTAQLHLADLWDYLI